MKHSLAIDRLTMTYSWYNIRSDYKNNAIKYTNDRGANWYTITFKDGMYSYTDINDYLPPVYGTKKSSYNRFTR